jgi:predicted ATPase/DNA-binding winged helix-turn-helix (wHTH) protein
MRVDLPRQEFQADPARDEVLCFGSFRLHRSQRLLLEMGKPVALGNRALDLLLALVDRAGQVVNKEELIARVWPKTVVEEINLRVHIAALRRALGDTQSPNQYVLNVVGRGYSFVASVSIERAPAVDRPSSAKLPPKREFPTPLTEVVGRDGDVADLVALLRTRRLVSITGSGGLGKTTLALAVAAQSQEAYKDGAYFVDLSAVSDASLISNAFAAVLGLAVDKDDPIPDLISYLKDKNILLVIDNCEHVIEGATRITESVLKGAARVHILATSREPLSAEGEWQYHLSALDVPKDGDSITAAAAGQYAAVQMFAERAMTSARAFELTDANAQSVSRICRRLEGNPLAIELAAAHLRLLGIHELAERLEDQFFLITNGRRTAVPRHHTLRATLDWSYALLSKSEQVTLQRLSLFNAAFTTESAVAVAAHRGHSSHEVRSAVMSLAVKSLITTDLSHNPVRHRLLYATRAYAFEKLSNSEDFVEIFRWHAEYVGKFLRQATINWESMDRTDWVAQYEYALDDIRAALDWTFSPNGDAALGAELTAASVAYGYQLGLLDEFHSRVEHALSWLANLPTRQLVIETRLKSALASMFLDRSPTKRDADIASSNDSSELTGVAKYQVGPILQKSILQIENGNYRGALASARKLTRVAARTGDPLAGLLANRLMAQALHFYGDHAAARGFAERVLDHSAKSFPLSYVAMQIDRRVSMRIIMSRILWIEGFADSAVEVINEGLEFAAADSPFSLCHALALAACPIALWRGEDAEADRLIGILLDQGARFKIDRWRTYGECYSQVNRMRMAGDVTKTLQASELPDLGTANRLILHMLATTDSAIPASLLPQDWVSDPVGWCAPELLRIQGERHLKGNAPDRVADAQAAFLKSFDLAEEHHALGWKLRTCMSLASLWRDQNQLDKARDLLSTAYGQIVEGHQTRDVRDAAAMLDELR